MSKTILYDRECEARHLLIRERKQHRYTPDFQWFKVVSISRVWSIEDGSNFISKFAIQGEDKSIINVNHDSNLFGTVKVEELKLYDFICFYVLRNTYPYYFYI
jgi:hypothetical protein